MLEYFNVYFILQSFNGFFKYFVNKLFKMEPMMIKKQLKNKQMKKYFFTFLTLIIFNFSLISQEKIDGHLKAINDYIASYNSQDFGKMRKNFSSVLKLVFTEKRLEQLYGYQYKLLGKAKIDKIEKRTEKSYFIDLKYALDTTEVQKIGLTLTEKNKIIGLFNPNFKFIYSKQENTNELNNQKVFTKLDSLVELKHKVANFNGCITVIKDKNEYYKNCKGDLKIDNQESLNENTLFDLASCSKPFTAMSIMILQEQGKLNYSDNIEKFLPDFPYKDITIENLLTHTSGLPDYMELFEKNWDKSKIATNKDVLELLMKYKPKMSFKPGKQYEYCNTGYAVLSSIIEKISGQSFKDFMSDSIFKPLGMNRTQVYNSRYTNIEILKNRASGHSYSDDLKKIYRGK